MGGVGGGRGLGVFLDHFWGPCLPVEEVWICALFFRFLWGVSFIFFVARSAGKGNGMGCKRTTLDRQRPYAGGGGGM